MSGPEWKDAPDEPGVWVLQEYWNDNMRRYDADKIRTVVMLADGPGVLCSNGKPYAIPHSKYVLSRWFGPIPNDTPNPPTPPTPV